MKEPCNLYGSISGPQLCFALKICFFWLKWLLMYTKTDNGGQTSSCPQDSALSVTSIYDLPLFPTYSSLGSFSKKEVHKSKSKSYTN